MAWNVARQIITFPSDLANTKCTKPETDEAVLAKNDMEELSL